MMAPQLALLLLLAAAASRSEPLILPAPSRLLVEGLEPAVAFISEPRPRFSFDHGAATTEALARGAAQASYRITVASLPHESVAPLSWDSGVVHSTSCSQIEYNGTALVPFTSYRWTVEWEASTGESSAPASAIFETGPMAQRDWHGADWLTGSQLRYELTLPDGSAIDRARAYVAAVGCHSLVVNGGTPAPDYRGICPWAVNGKNIRYQTHNISTLLQQGHNGVGLLNGQVMAQHQPSLMAVIVIHLRGSAAPVIFTTGSHGWKQTGSYISGCNDALGHCDMHHNRVMQAWATSVDWNRHDPAWSQPGYNATGWATASSQKSTNPALALAMPLSVVLGEVRPTEVSVTPDGAWLYKFPKNFVGTVRMAALPNATQGSILSLQLGEWLDVERRGVPAHPPSPPCTTKPQSCPGHANHNRTFCPSSHASGQCDKPMPHLPCPPCPPAPPAPPPPSTSKTWPTISGGQLQYEDHILRPGNTEPLETLFCWQ